MVMYSMTIEDLQRTANIAFASGIRSLGESGTIDTELAKEINESHMIMVQKPNFFKKLFNKKDSDEAGVEYRLVKSV